MRKMKEALNLNMVDQFNLSWINVIDEIIMEWFNWICPGLLCIGHKPRPFVN